MRSISPARTLLLCVLCVAPASAQLVASGHQRFDQGQLGNAVEAHDHFGEALAAGDFNGDGRFDLAIGLPDEDVGSIQNAGSVIVVYGTTLGLHLDPDSAPFPLSLHQDVGGVGDAAETGDRFGAALAAGDFNGDGFAELVVGIPSEDIEPEPGILIPDAGVIQVFFGSAVGIVPANDAIWDQDDFDGLSFSNLGDVFGSALAVCDRNADGFDDLVIGLPGEDYLAREDSGAIIIMRGSAGGLDPAGGGYWGGGGTPTAPAAGDRFGSAIACGRLDAGVIPEIAAGAPFGRASGAPPGAGLVRTLMGSGLANEAAGYHDNGRYGSAVAIAGAPGTAGSRLLIGFPGFGWGGVAEGGSVHQIGGPTAFEQGWRGLLETREAFDQLGSRLAVGDFNDDGVPDAVFGVPGENLRDGTGFPRLDAGTVHVLFAKRNGVSTSANQDWNWDSPGLEFSPVDNDEFGGALAAGDFDGDGIDDLAIGAPGAEWSGVAGTGLVEVLYGTNALIFADTFEHGEVWTSW